MTACQMTETRGRQDLFYCSYCSFLTLHDVRTEDGNFTGGQTKSNTIVMPTVRPLSSDNHLCTFRGSNWAKKDGKGANLELKIQLQISQ